MLESHSQFGKKNSNIKALQYAFRDRKNRKREIRSLWISRINAATRELNIPYSVFQNSLTKKNIMLNRKILSDIAIKDKKAFKEILNIAVK